MDSDRSERVIAGIVTFRNKQRRFGINKKISTKIKPVTSRVNITRILDSLHDNLVRIHFHRVRNLQRNGKRTYRTRYWISDTYDPQGAGNFTRQFWDLCFGLMEDEYVVLGGYLGNFFSACDETWITIGLVLTKNMHDMIATYDSSKLTCENVSHFFE